MSDATYMRFAIVVMDRGRDRWREDFLDELARRGVTLHNDETHLNEIHLRGEWMGEGRLEPLETADATLSEWIAIGDRPFIGAPAGLFVWSHFMAPSDSHDLVEALAHAALGAGYRFDSHELREHVVRRQFELVSLTSPYGFDEGTALLERQPGLYMDDVVGAVKRLLAENEIEAWAGFDPNVTEGNPVRLYPPMEIAGKPISNSQVDSVLHRLTVEIWAFHRQLGYPNDHFWTDADA